MTDMDLEAIQHLDFDPDDIVPCAGVFFKVIATGYVTKFEKCDNPAEFSLKRKCCGKEKLTCLKCTNEIIEYIAQKIIENPNGVKCAPCDVVYTLPPYIMRAL